MTDDRRQPEIAAPQPTRRQVLLAGAGAGVLALGGSLWADALRSPAAAAVSKGAGPYGALLAPDARGLSLPRGFRSRIIARSGQAVGPSGYRWHGAPDGGACFPAASNGWTYVSNSELASGGGASMVGFDATGKIIAARRILSGTRANCAGGPTPWGRWLSCEETDRGFVYDCDPTGRSAPVRRDAMGRFKHEAAAVDPDRRVIYLTEDERDGCFYKFAPSRWPDLGAGSLSVLSRMSGALSWQRVPDASAASIPTRHQLSNVLRFNGGEGCWYSRGSVFFTAKGENRVWQYLASSSPPRLGVFYDLATSGGAALSGVDNITGATTGDLFVAEDGGNMQICVLAQGSGVAPFLQLKGHDASELTGPAFSPDGKRMYFSSQRGTTGRSGDGVTFEISGPFRT